MMEQCDSLNRLTLYIGCRHPRRDELYESELQSWTKRGDVNLGYAHSTGPGQNEGCKYVLYRFWKDREEVISLVNRKGKAFVYGSEMVLECI